eukprot:845440_1
MATHPEVYSVLPQYKYVKVSSMNPCHDCKREIKTPWYNKYRFINHCNYCGWIICNQCWNKYFAIYCSPKGKAIICICFQCDRYLQPFSEQSVYGYIRQECQPLLHACISMDIKLLVLTYCFPQDQSERPSLCQPQPVPVKQMQNKPKTDNGVTATATKHANTNDNANGHDNALNIQNMCFLSVVDIEYAMDTFKMQWMQWNGTGPLINCIQDKNTLYFMTISHLHRNNLFMNIVDSYRRSSAPSVSEWIRKSPWLKKLESKLKSQNIKGVELDLVTAVPAYLKRITPLNNGTKHKPYLINDNIQSIISWLGTSRMFVQWILHQHDTPTAPFMLDFIFLVKTRIHDDRGERFHKKKAKNIDLDQRLAGCTWHEASFGDNIQLTKPFVEGLFAPFKHKMIQQRSAHVGYPHYRRFNVIMDRRKKDKNGKFRVIMFDPPNNCNVIQKQHFVENMFGLSAKCLIPGSQRYNRRIAPLTTRSAHEGQLLSFSYHVHTCTHISVYMYWKGQCHRFYPSDITTELPRLFDPNNAASNGLSILYDMQWMNRGLCCLPGIKDADFEIVHRAIDGIQKDKFPKKMPCNHHNQN